MATGLKFCRKAISSIKKVLDKAISSGLGQVAKLGPVSRAAGMDCEYPLDPNKL